ncbi:hypothetical protein RBH29_16000 [Herbivorax sp. ANBcel31]|uniref:hypothetical protein n=1 Tax=Herbivorax sp. ANBcel31 TaxID=3069754 RepID=UPI0027B6A35F|nr:hypothetical protein [Herbivorax sp. ANBcel31]MDQ2087933.1 hypothetical protein [Herbivorax sp. ANBcel31]
MCFVKAPVENERDINFIIYNMVLSKKHKEFTIDEITNELQDYIDWEYQKIELKVKKLVQIWMKSGIIEEHINSFVRV